MSCLRVKVCVCQLSPSFSTLSQNEEWMNLKALVKEEKPDLILLNELPFGEWKGFYPNPTREGVEEMLKAHEEGFSTLVKELECPAILSTRPNGTFENLVNEAFIWTKEDGFKVIHKKQYFPDEESYWEAKWFKAGDKAFEIGEIDIPNKGKVRLGFMICSDLWFMEQARFYKNKGAHIICVPRCTPTSTVHRWKVAFQFASMSSGCYVLSSNRGGLDQKNNHEFGGFGCVASPDGDIIASTSKNIPIVFYSLDLSKIGNYQSEYPCSMPETFPKQILINE